MTFKKALLALAVAAVTVAVIGISANAASNKGVAGKSFAVQVSGWEDPFLNCYRFDDNGDWYDLALNALNEFPTPAILGEWEQRGNGSSPWYDVKVDLGPAGTMKQEGKVTANKDGVLTLTATTVVPAGVLPNVPADKKVILHAEGSEVESCPEPPA